MVRWGGVPSDGQSIQVTTELLKATLSSGYFAACMYLMYRLYRHQEIALSWTKSNEVRSIKRDRKHDN